MIHRIYFILLLLSLSFTAKAQLGKELIPNGGFEEYAKVTPPPSGEDDEEDEEEEPPGYFDPYQKPLYWSFNSSLFYTRIKDAHSGVFAVKVYPNGGSFFSRDENFNPYHIAIEAGGEYRLTYWYKGNVKNPNITVTVDWYKGTTSIKKETRDKEKATDFSDQWQQKTFTFKAPAGVDKAGVVSILKTITSRQNPAVAFLSTTSHSCRPKRGNPQRRSKRLPMSWSDRSSEKWSCRGMPLPKKM